MKARLRYILFAAFTFVSIVPVVFLAYWTQNAALEKEVQAVEEKHLLLAHNLTGGLSRYVTDVRNTFRVTTDILNEQSFLPKQFSGFLADMDIRVVASFDLDAESVRIINGEVGALPEELPLTLQAELDQLATADVDDILFSGVKSSREGIPMLYLLRRGNDSQVFMAGLSTDFIVTVQQKVAFGLKGHAAIVDGNGRVLAHPKPEWRHTMKDISKIKPVKLMMAGKTGVTTFYSPAMKADMVAGYAPVANVGWGVMIPQPYQELLDRAGGVKLLALAVALLGLAVASLISWWLSGVISGPIRAVVKSARALSRGEVSQVNEIEVFGTEELKELITVFNGMAKDVEANKADLELRVSERTLELSDEIAQRAIIEDKIRHLANHDSLTGLANRTLLMDRVEMGLAASRRQKSTLALLFLDLDEFKPVNDQYGHSVGDLLLQAVALRLDQVTREVDTVARYGGDEFVIVLDGDLSIEGIETVAGKIQQALTNSFQIEGRDITISGSIGIAISANGNKTPESMLDEADHAMYDAKKAGRNCVRFSNLK